MAYKFNLGTVNLKGVINMDSATSVAHKDGSIATDDLANDAIDSTKIADDAVGADQIADGAVDAARLASDAVTSAKIADNAIENAHMADDSVGAAELIDDSVGAAAIADNVISNAHMADDSVGANELIDDSVGAAAMADDAVGTSVIVDNAVTLAKMAGVAQGNLIIGDASGDPAYLDHGAANTVLSSNGTTISYTSVSNDMIANSSITINGSAISLGGSVTTPNDNDNVSKGNLTTVLASYTDADTLRIGDTGNDTNVIIRGNLQVEGTTTTVNSTTLTIDDRIITIGDGLADLAAGVSATAGFEIGNNLASMKLDSNVDGAGLDGFTVSLPLKATSFHGNGASLTGVVADGMKHSLTNITNNTTVSEPGMIIANLGGSSATLTISGSFNQGDQILVKGNNNLSTSVVLTITGAAGSGFNFDGEQSIQLDSPRAGLTLIYDGDSPNALWHIM